MIVKELSWHDGALTVVTESDPLLRRFGQLDYVLLEEGGHLEIRRKQADEIWAVISGTAAMIVEDRREDSPSFGVSQVLPLDGESPRAVLVPFGTSCKIEGHTSSVLLRLTTHQDN